MALNVGAPARGLIETLNAGGSWGTDNERTGGTWPGTIVAGSAYQPSAPYEGATPAVFVSSIPLVADINFEGALCHKLSGSLELYYIDRLSIEQNVPLAVLDKRMADNFSAIVNAILADHTLNGSVVSVTQPISLIRDPEGLFREWQGAPWLWASMHIAFISRPSIP